MKNDPERIKATTDTEKAFAYHQAGLFDQAREIYLRILRYNPDDYNALQLLGVLAVHDGDYSLAVELISRAARVVDSDPSIFNNLGEAYRGLNQLKDAEQCFRRALNLDSNYALAYNNLATVLHHFKRSLEAEEACRHALACHPFYAEAYNNLGIILADLNKYDEAETAYRQALNMNNDYFDGYVNLGILYKNMGRYRESEQVYRKALRLNPHASEALYNLSILELLQGKLRKGFEHYENRVEKHDILLSAPLECPPWQGQKLDGKSLLLITEQGAGDSIMMMRYLRVLKKSKFPGRIGVYCDVSLQRIFSSFPEVDQLYLKPESPPFNEFDYHCPMMSLPYLFKTTLFTIPQPVPPVCVPDEIKIRWQNQFSNLQGIKVGLAWSGNRELKADARRSIPLSVFMPLRDVPGIHYFSLQKGYGSEQLLESDWNIIDVMDDCKDYLETASLIDMLDLVISVDTSVVHLAGVIGKRLWLLNRFESEWRWMLEREDSPWYPTLKIFHQESISDWSHVMQRVADELRRMVDSHQNSTVKECRNDDFHQGLAFLVSKDFVNAAECFETVLSQFPGNADVHNNLGIAYFEIGFTDDAKDEFKTATKIDPEHAEAWKNLGKAIRDTGGNSASAASCFRKALSLVPDSDDAWMMLGTTLLDRGRSAEAVKCFRKSLELNPYNCDAHSNLLFAMNYLSQVSQADLLAESLQWNDVHTAGIFAMQHESGTDRFRNGRLHIGFVSGDFKRHPVGYHLLPILAAHDREQFAIYCYETIHEPDDLTVQMQEYVDGWRDISRLSDEDAAKVVCDDRIDILIDLAGYTKGSRLCLFAHKPAPVQVSWLGYFNTTGVKAIDYMIADETTIPAGEERLYSEKIIRLPGSRFCYAPPDYAPQVVEPPVLNNGFITFGSFNNLAKLSSETVQLWSRVLMAVPGSRLLLKWSTLGRKKERDSLLRKFSRSGIDAERLLLRGKSSHSGMLLEYGDVDIALDPFPFSGGMTSCEALWMGVPVLTLLGDKPAGRQTAGFLRTIGLTEWVALTEEQFVSRAIHAASNPEGLKAIRYGLRDRMTVSTLCDGVRFTQNLESIFREISLKCT